MAKLLFKGNLTKHFSIAEYTIENTSDCYLTEKAYLQALMLEEFRQWFDKPMIVTSWYRSAALNKSKNGIPTSNHLTGCATDWHISGIKITKALFIKYAKKWRKICKAHGVIGEAGLYKWGIHFGSSITYSKSFTHWDCRTGKQINNPFEELL